VSKDTVNRLSAPTVSQVFAETLPDGGEPLQWRAVKDGDGADLVRAVHGAAYTRLLDADPLSMAREFATDLRPPHEAGFTPRGWGSEYRHAPHACKEPKDLNSRGCALLAEPYPTTAWGLQQFHTNFARSLRRADSALIRRCDASRDSGKP
jgi:hypothetical protein